MRCSSSVRGWNQAWLIAFTNAARIPISVPDGNSASTPCVRITIPRRRAGEIRSQPPAFPVLLWQAHRSCSPSHEGLLSGCFSTSNSSCSPESRFAGTMLARFDRSAAAHESAVSTRLSLWFALLLVLSCASLHSFSSLLVFLDSSFSSAMDSIARWVGFVRARVYWAVTVFEKRKRGVAI